jgi:glycosyltransferase involved in cell wall biosynthesis
MAHTFSIITPTILRPSLRETCHSIETQSYTEWEHIVIIDLPAVNDHQRQFVRSLEHPSRRIFYCGVQHGDFGNTCRNAAFEFSRGEYLMYLDDDDIYYPECLAEVRKACVDNPFWGIFPIENCGQFFLNVPPGINLTCSNQFFYRRDLNMPFPNSNYVEDAYSADGTLIERLKQFPYTVIQSKPLARVDRHQGGVFHSES